MPLDDRLRIEVLLKEYETLRTEILARIQSRFVLLGMVGAFLAFTFFNESQPFQRLFPSSVIQWAVCAYGGAILFYVWIRMGHLIGALAKRVAAIEVQVNTIAGEELMVWESRREQWKHLVSPNIVRAGPRS